MRRMGAILLIFASLAFAVPTATICLLALHWRSRAIAAASARDEMSASRRVAGYAYRLPELRLPPDTVAFALPFRPGDIVRKAVASSPLAPLEFVRFDEPTLPPMAHTRFCLAYSRDCEAHPTSLGSTAVSLTEERWVELLGVNERVNGTIVPQRNEAGVMGERWILYPKAGDCNDYAVTKRHELLRRGWPSDALLLAEVVMPSREHHLVLVVRTRRGDLVLDNLSPEIRNWTDTGYRWVRIQSPANPRYWSRVASAAT